jgi:integrase
MLIRFHNIPVIVDSGGNVIPSIAAWAYFLKEGQDKSANTVDAYISGLSLCYDYTERYVTPDGNTNPLTLLINFKRMLLEGSAEMGWPPHSGSYVNKVLTVISLFANFIDMDEAVYSEKSPNRFYLFAKKSRAFLGHIKKGKGAQFGYTHRQRNVRVNHSKYAQEEVRYFPPERFWEFISNVPSYRDKAFYTLILGTSARVSQALNVWQRDIHFDTGKVEFIDPRSDKRKRALWDRYGLQPDDRILNKSHLPGIWLVPQLEKAFIDYAIKYRETAFIPESKQSRPHPYFFQTRSGRRLKPRQVNEQFTRIIARMGLDGMTPHSLRHLYGYYSHNILKVDRAVIQHNMGHRHISSTEIYTRIPNEVSAKAFKEALAKLLSEERRGL